MIKTRLYDCGMTFKRPPGRPAKGAGRLRNMRLVKAADDFLTQEKQRSGKPDMTLVMECALLELEKIKPPIRDTIYQRALARNKPLSTGRGVESARPRAAVPNPCGSAANPGEHRLGRPTLNIEHPA
ncbi:MAG: hypothetical protein ABSE16_05545 [Verrucomicrobiota bacterium]|jgi:hypothetical protein